MKTLWMRRPKTVQAIQFTGDNYDEICEFAGDLFRKSNRPGIHYVLECRDTVLDNVAFERPVNSGDFIVKCMNDKQYPFKVMDGNTLDARYTLVSRGKVSEMECNFYSQSMLDMSRICD